MPSGIAYVSIGVADMQPVAALWIDQLGLEVTARRSGGDPQLEALWDLPADSVVEQLLLHTPGANTGLLHFVQTRNPGPAIRANAAPYDLGAKNLDVNCTDLPGMMARLSQAGYSFRSDMVEYTLEDVHAREVQMPGHDGLNLAFIEALSAGFETPYSSKGFAALTSFVVIVEDTATEAAFYENLFGFDEIMEHRLSGPDIEKVVGLPKGAGLNMSLFGKADNMFGRMELVNYEGLEGVNRFALAEPPATGILRCGFRVNSLDAMLAKAVQLGVQVSEPEVVDLIFGAGRLVELRSPAGLHIQVLEVH